MLQNNPKDLLDGVNELIETCLYCGKKYNSENVKAYVDQHFGVGKYDWVRGNYGQLCDSCAFGKLLEEENNSQEDQ